MLSLPPLPPPPPPLPQDHPQRKQSAFVPLDRTAIPKKYMKPESPLLHKTETRSEKPTRNQPPPLLQPRPPRTTPFVWFCSILCLLFSLVFILFGIAILVIFTGVKPRIPIFDTAGASLTSIYFDSPEYFNGDFTLQANFTNPNQKMDLRFEHLLVELYFYDRLIASQAIQPFSQKRKEKGSIRIQFLSSLAYLPLNIAAVLQKQKDANSIFYNIRATYKVRASLGIFHFSYWVHSRCQLQLTAPPAGVLVARRCSTKR